MINLAQVLGRVGKIDTRTTSTGTKITNISMVTSKKYVKNGEKQEKITWHNITLFMKLAEIAEKYVNVGDLLYIQGEMDSQKYTSKDGQERTNFIIIASDIRLMPKSKEHKKAPEEKQYQADGGDDDVPW
jgi:single-strand DNA-binding protein